MTKIKDSLLAQGYPAFTLEDFHDTVNCSFEFSTKLNRRYYVHSQFIETLESTSNPETTVESLTKVCCVYKKIGHRFKSVVECADADISGSRCVRLCCLLPEDPDIWLPPE